MSAAALEYTTVRKRKVYEPKTCPACGKVFTPPPNTYKRQRHCSFVCGHGSLRYTPERATAMFWMRVKQDKDSGCWEFQGARDKWGYGDLNYLGKHVQAHRIAWRLLRGSPGEMDVLHTCHNPPCCNPDHLYLGTDVENARDRVAAGRHARGERARAKLKESQVREILALRGKETQRLLAERYGVSQTAVGAIFRGKSWKHIPA